VSTAPAAMPRSSVECLTPGMRHTEGQLIRVPLLQQEQRYSSRLHSRRKRPSETESGEAHYLLYLLKAEAVHDSDLAWSA